MKFWRDNRLDQEHEADPVEVARAFYDSGTYTQDLMLERQLRLWVSDNYGVWENETAFSQIVDAAIRLLNK